AAWAKARKTAHDVDLTPRVPAGRGGVATLDPPGARKAARTVEIDDDHFLSTSVPQKEIGVLRPTVLVGVGSFGRRALQEIRCRLIDRVGDVTQVPVFRFLYVDCDPDAATKAVSAPPDVALSPDEVFPVPLQPVTGYRRRQLDQILDWLPREKLYAIPRTLQAGGQRALGRLAFCDNYLRFVTRLRRELQIATHPESVTQSADQTGLLARDGGPQVYVFASATGGAGGMLPDLGYAVRRVLARMNAPNVPVAAFVYAASPTDPGSEDHELANVYATLTELNHFADPEVTFAAHYGGPEGPKVEGKGLPFSATYLLPMPERSSQAFRDCVSHLAGYVSHDLTTPLGPALEQVRSEAQPFGRSPFRGFGTYGVWFPRGLLLRTAAAKICTRLLRHWGADVHPTDRTKIDLVVTQVMGDTRLKPEAVQRQLEEAAPRGPEGPPSDQVERWLHGLEGQIEAAGRRSEAGKWASGAWEQAREFIGTRPTSDADSTVRRGRLSKASDEAVRRVAEAWGNEFAEQTRVLEEDPGNRLATVEAALRRLVGLCDEAAAAVDRKLDAFGLKVRQSRADVQSAMDACRAGSGAFSFFGGRGARSMRHFLDQLRGYARLRLQEDLIDATARFYRALRGQVEARLRTLSYCRSRLDHVASGLESPLAGLPVGTDTPLAISEEALQQTIHPTNTLQVVLPSGDNHIERSAGRVVKSVKPADLLRLEHALQKLVLEPRKGLISLCGVNADLSRTLLAPMIEQTTAFLGDLLPATDVTEVEVSACRAKNVDAADRVKDYYDRAHPPADSVAEQKTFVIVPDSEAGKAFAGVVKRALSSAQTIPVQGAATDLMFCREQACMKPAELMQLLSGCLPAYYQALATPQTNPHSRFDVTDWMPIAE
ncbi:MAG TPA: tubulin-like doman-containing protein, partial [Urbifossiella sp.]|nr:tubulin-like doman-containing protein [Urbifossiella sp.]